MIGGGETLVQLCKVNGIGYRGNELGGGGSGTVGSYEAPS